jgi:hypothetical protein
MKRLWSVALLLGTASTGCILGCSSPPPPEVLAAHLNPGAAITGRVPANPVEDWRVITSFADDSTSTMSTLYGNSVATLYARRNAQHDYPAGSVVSLVTWTQREDPRWYGAQIPGQSQSIEFVTVGSLRGGKPFYTYEKYEGTPLAKTVEQDSPKPNKREAFLLSLRAAVLP